MKRCRKHFDLEEYKQRVQLIDNLDVTNSAFIENISEVLDMLAPLKDIQQDHGYCGWLSDDTTCVMVIRDEACELARVSKLPDDWSHYKKLRNEVTALVSKDKRNY